MHGKNQFIIILTRETQVQLIHPYLSDERPAMNRRYNRIIGILFFNIIIISTLPSSTKSRGRSGYPSRLRTRSCRPTLCPRASQAPWPWCSSRASASTTHAPGSACTPGTPDRGSSPVLWTAASEITSSHLDKKLTDYSTAARMSVPHPPAAKRNQLNGSAVHEEFMRVNITNPKTGKIVQGSECKHCPSVKTPLTSINPSNLKRHLESASCRL